MAVLQLFFALGFEIRSLSFTTASFARKRDARYRAARKRLARDRDPTERYPQHCVYEKTQLPWQMITCVSVESNVGSVSQKSVLA